MRIINLLFLVRCFWPIILFHFEFFHSTVFTRDFSSRVLMAQSTGLSATLDVAVIQRIKRFYVITSLLKTINLNNLLFSFDREQIVESLWQALASF